MGFNILFGPDANLSWLYINPQFWVFHSFFKRKTPSLLLFVWLRWVGDFFLTAHNKKNQIQKSIATYPAFFQKKKKCIEREERQNQGACGFSWRGFKREGTNLNQSCMDMQSTDTKSQQFYFLSQVLSLCLIIHTKKEVQKGPP